MGLYDTLVFLDNPPQCAHGHGCTDFQTKDLGEDMKSYYVCKGVIYDRSAAKIKDATPELVDNNLIIKTTNIVPKANLRNHTIEIHAFCDECEPIYVATQRGWRGNIDTRTELLSWEVSVHNGVIEEIRPLKVPTREEFRRQEIKEGAHVLDDNDPAVIAYKRSKNE